MSGVGSDQVRSIIQRILRLKEEQDALSEDIREVYAEAKSNGFDKTALGQAVTAIRKREKDASKFEEQETVVGLYLAAFYGANSAPARARVETIEEFPSDRSGSHPVRNVVAPSDADDRRERISEAVTGTEEIGSKSNASKAFRPVTGPEEIPKGAGPRFRLPADRVGCGGEMARALSLHSDGGNASQAAEHEFRTTPDMADEEGPSPAALADAADELEIPGFLRRVA